MYCPREPSAQSPGLHPGGVALLAAVLVTALLGTTAWSLPAATSPGADQERPWALAAEALRDGRLKEAAGAYASLGAAATSGTRRLEAVRALIAAGEPVSAHRIAWPADDPLAGDAHAEMARVLAAQKLGDIGASAERLNGLAARSQEHDPYLSYLVARHMLLIDAPAKVRPLWPALREMGARYPEALVAGFESAGGLNLTAESAQWADAFLKTPPAHEAASATWFREIGALRAKYPSPLVRTVHGVVRLPMTVDPLPMVDLEAPGGVVLHLIVDTGADALYLDEAAARRLGCELQLKATNIKTLAAACAGHLTVVPELAAGGLQLRSIPTVTFDWQAQVKAMRQAIAKRQDRAPDAEASVERLATADGFISAALIAGEDVLWFDVVRRSLVVAPSQEQAGIPQSALRGPLFGRKQTSLPVIIAPKLPTLALIDTGHNAPLSVDEAYYRYVGSPGQPLARQEGVAVDAAGLRALADDAVALHLNLWSAQGPGLDRVPATVGKLDPGDLHGPARCAVIGWEIWKRLSPALDWKQGQLVLIPTRDEPGRP